MSGSGVDNIPVKEAVQNVLSGDDDHLRQIQDRSSLHDQLTPVNSM